MFESEEDVLRLEEDKERRVLPKEQKFGKKKRMRVEREVGGGVGMGNTCKSMADSCQCMTKTTTIS